MVYEYDIKGVCDTEVELTQVVDRLVRSVSD